MLLVEHDPVGELAGAPLLALAGATTSWALVRPVDAVLGPGLSASRWSPATRPPSRGWRAGCASVAGGVSGVLQALVAALWDDPDVGEQVAAAARAYASRRSGLLAALAARGVAARAAARGLQVWVPTEDETTAVARLLAAGWLVAPGRAAGCAARPGCRVGLAQLGGVDLGRLADDLRDAVGA